jgi:hypothetical protein
MLYKLLHIKTNKEVAIYGVKSKVYAGIDTTEKWFLVYDGFRFIWVDGNEFKPLIIDYTYEGHNERR